MSAFSLLFLSLYARLLRITVLTFSLFLHDSLGAPSATPSETPSSAPSSEPTTSLAPSTQNAPSSNPTISLVPSTSPSEMPSSFFCPPLGEDPDDWVDCYKGYLRSDTSVSCAMAIAAFVRQVLKNLRPAMKPRPASRRMGAAMVASPVSMRATKAPTSCRSLAHLAITILHAPICFTKIRTAIPWSA